MDNSSLQGLAQTYGTPLYIFDYDALRKQIKQLEDVFPSRVRLCFAMKANPFLVDELDKYVPLFEVCSPGELTICKKRGISPEKIVFSGVYKDPQLVRTLVAEKTPMHVYTAESETQWKLLLDCAQENGVRLPVLPRISCSSQFGIDPNRLKELIVQYQDAPQLDIQGVQYFSGTQKTSLKKIKRELRFLDTYLTELKEACGFEPAYVEYGPGLPAEYFNDNAEEVASEMAAHLQGFAQLLEEAAYQGPLVFEIGRGIAASCGTYLTRVVDAKTNDGVNYAIVDGGMHQLVFYGHAMAMRQPVCTVLPERDNSDAPLWAVCGALCSTNDILLKQLPANNLAIGDVLAFPHTGAYCMTEGISLFLSRDLPRIIAVSSGQEPHVLREAFDTSCLNTAL